MKQFVQALDKNGQCFQYICQKFTAMSIEKTKGGIFDCPQIKRLIKDSSTFETYMTKAERLAWDSSVVVISYLGNRKDENYIEFS